MQYPHALKNGELIPSQQATASLTNIGFVYGFGVYESVRVKKGSPLFLADHMERLEHSAGVIGLEHMLTQQLLTDWTTLFVETLDDVTCNLKYLLLGGRTAEDASLTIMASNPRFPDRKLYKTGASVITVPGERAFPTAKTLNMLPSYLAYSKARKEGHADALFVHADGVIREATTANLFTLNGRTITTPSDDLVLQGVTRKYVLKTAEQEGFTIEYADHTLDSLREANAIFVTSTGKKILPITQIDGTLVGGVTDELAELMTAYEKTQS
jgi:branched-subunit amino acid aminotransferase/4-amino-4-deoxychorismate lyase